MDPKNIDEKIATERHNALAYSTYTSGKAPQQQAKRAFIRFDYMSKKTLLLTGLAGVVLVVGLVGFLASRKPNASTIAQNNGSDSATTDFSDGGEVVYAGDETNSDGSLIEEGANTPHANPTPSSQESSSVVSQVFESLGLVKPKPTPTPTTPSTQPAPSSPTSPSSPSPSTPSTPKITKLLVFVEENHTFAQMKNNMPYTYKMAQKYAYATNYFAIRHPSLPNYIAIATGSTRGITDSKAPAANSFTGSSVFGQAIRNNKTAKVYAESMPSNCKLVNDGKYVVRHNPWAYVSNERTWCKKYDVRMSAFSYDVTNGKLPNVGMVIPNMCNNAHDCPLKTADDWFKQRMQKILDGPDWKAGRLAVVLTADEDDKSSNNRVLTVVMHPSLNSVKKACSLNHYSLSRLFSEVTHTTPILKAKDANSMKSCFNLPI